MTKRGRFVVTGVFVLALMLMACGSGDATEDGNDLGDDGVTDDVGTDNTAPPCGNGTCETGEGCSSCESDCSCAAEYTTCREDACVDWDAVNPLLKKLPGHWVRVDPPDTNTEVDVTVDPSDPDCHNGLASEGYNPDPNPNEPGDACVVGFVGAIVAVLHGSSISMVLPDTIDSADGQVLSNGTRVEFTRHYEGNDYPQAYERQ